MKRGQGLAPGPAISKVGGEMLLSNNIDERLGELLEEMYEEDSSGFPNEVDSKEKIAEYCHCFRTFRRLLDTRAMNQGVSGTDVDVVSRWTKKERSGGKSVSGPMKHHYSDSELLIKPFK